MLVQFNVDTNALKGEFAAQERKSLEAAAMFLMHMASPDESMGTLADHTHPCAGENCGTTTFNHSPECVAEHGRASGAPLDKQPDMLSAEVIFGKQTVPQGTSNVLPFPGAPSLPAVNTAVLPALPVVATSVADVSAAASVNPAQGATLPAVPSATVELDSAGLPWDARIHQTNRNKKADGTWMLKRGLDKTLAATVLAELVAAKLSVVKDYGPSPHGVPSVPHIPPAAPAAGPVTLPPVSLPLPPVPGTVGLPVLPTLPPAPSDASLPVESGGAVAPTPVERFRAMMVKIGAALGAQTVTQEQVVQAHTNLGLTQLQLAITKPELIPEIETVLGL